MKKVLFKTVVTLIGVLIVEKIYTKGYGDGYDNGVDDALFVTTAISKKLRKEEESE